MSPYILLANNRHEAYLGNVYESADEAKSVADGLLSMHSQVWHVCQVDVFKAPKKSKGK